MKNLDSKKEARLKEKLFKEFDEKSERIHSMNQLLKAYTLFEKDIEYVINLLDPDESGTVFKDFDEFKIKDPTTGIINKISYAEVMERLGSS